MPYPAAPLPQDWLEQCARKTLPQAIADFAAMGYPIARAGLWKRAKRAGVSFKNDTYNAKRIPRDYWKYMPDLTIKEGAAKWGVPPRCLKDKCLREKTPYKLANRQADTGHGQR